MYEDYLVPTWEDQIGPAWEVTPMQPVSVPECVHKLTNHYFWLRIRATHAAHPFAALLLR
jgi:hypothetical protein